MVLYISTKIFFLYQIFLGVVITTRIAIFDFNWMYDLVNNVLVAHCALKSLWGTPMPTPTFNSSIPIKVCNLTI